MMRHTGSVISGSMGVKISEGTNEWEANDMDIYVPVDHGDKVVGWLQSQGYDVKEEVKGDDGYIWDLGQVIDTMPSLTDGVALCLEAGNCIKTVYTLIHTKFGTKLNVIQSLSRSAVAPIPFFHSTLVMNFITGDGVVCGYPTLLKQKKGEWFNIQKLMETH